MTEPTTYKISNKKLLLAFGTAFIANLLLMVYHYSRYGAENLDGSYSEAGSTRIFISMIIGLVISIPLICLILSLLIASFVNRKVSYAARFRRVFLWTLLLVNTVMVLRVLVEVVFGV